MKILHINNKDIVGGAAKAAYRLHRGLLVIGEGSRMLLKKKANKQVVFVEFSEDHIIPCPCVHQDSN
jgi:hypothetical protein